MDKRAQLHQALKSFQEPAPVQVWPAIVKSVQGTNCTVDILNTDLVDVDEVNLRADDDAKEGVLLVPRVGSLVYVSALENAVDNLFVCLVSEVDRVELIIDKMKVSVDKSAASISFNKLQVTINDTVTVSNDQSTLTMASDTATLKQGASVVELKGGKVSVKNAGVSIKDLFDDLATLLQAFQVTCAAPGSPSAPFPASVAQVVQLKTKAALLLQ